MRWWVWSCGVLRSGIGQRSPQRGTADNTFIITIIITIDAAHIVCRDDRPAKRSAGRLVMLL